MIPVPIGTDAPLYHYPITTIGLIVANVVCFAMTGFGDPLTTEPWVLHFGVVPNPLEWLTSMFAHAGPGHILGNMFFLWGFGLIVEGKLGWYRTLALYLAIGMSQAALIQLIMWPFPGGGALGASSAIMGLMAISMVWAPKNNMKLFMLFWFMWIVRVWVFEVTVVFYALFYLGWDLLSFIVVHEGGMGTPALHLSGALIGFGAGTLFLHRGWVDCENWDLFRVLSGKYGREADPTIAVGSHADPTLMFGHSDVAVKDDLPDDSRAARMSKAMKQICELIDAGDVMTATERIYELRMQDDSPLPEPRLRKLCLGLLRADMYDDAEIYMEEYIETYDERAAWARIRLAQLLLQQRRRPAAALAQLKQVRRSELTAEQAELGRKVGAAARRQIKAGVQDAEPDW